MITFRPRTILLTLVVFLPLSFLLLLHPSTPIPQPKKWLSTLPNPLPSFSSTVTSRIEGVLYIINPSKLVEHPILQLIEESKSKQAVKDQKLLDVSGVEDAIKDYLGEFGMLPPEGFERWYEFARSISSTTLPSQIPEAHLSVLPYLSLPPKILRERTIALIKDRGVFGMTLYPRGEGSDIPGGYRADAENVDVDGVFWEKGGRVKIEEVDFMVSYMSPRWDYPNLLEPILDLLPSSIEGDEPVMISACVRDGSCRLVAGEIMEESRRLAKEHRVWNMNDLEKLENDSELRRGWQNTCPAGSLEPIQEPKAVSSFITDLTGYMDFCKRPELMGINGEMIMEDEHIMRPLAPMLAVSRLMHGADMIGVPTRSVNGTFQNFRAGHPLMFRILRTSLKSHPNTIAYVRVNNPNPRYTIPSFTDVSVHQPFSSKTKSQAVWRGTITGIFHRSRWDWRKSHRDRLSFLASGNTSSKKVELLEEGLLRGVKRRNWDLGGLVEKWLDVGVIEEDIENMCGPGPTEDACRIDGGEQDDCPERDQACDEMVKEIQWVDRMTNEEAALYKYRLDIDGYGWSSRFRKLLSTNSLIIKSTLYPEWWTAQATPWYHFIPMQYTYSDLFDILAFFDGSPDGKIPGRSSLAEEIAGQGREFALQKLRWEDMQSYMFLFLLEYRRAWSLDRDAATYKPGTV